jgi:transcriptional regulator ATRX
MTGPEKAVGTVRKEVRWSRPPNSGRHNTTDYQVLLVCPLGSILIWKKEFDRLPPESRVKVFESVSQPGKGSKEWRDDTIESWYKSGGVMIIGNDMFRNLTNPKLKQGRSC